MVQIDYKNVCETYSDGVGCYETFDGSCIKERCFTYRLLQQLADKEKEVAILKKENDGLKSKSNFIFDEEIVQRDNYIEDLMKALDRIRDLAGVNSVNTCWTAINLCTDCEEYEECGLQGPFEKLKAILDITKEFNLPSLIQEVQNDD